LIAAGFGKCDKCITSKKFVGTLRETNESEQKRETLGLDEPNKVL